MKLPDVTQVYCAHEYTQANGRFSQTIEPQNSALITRVEQVKQMRAANQPTIPTTIGAERETNPFVRAISAEKFAQIRLKKDHF